MSSGNDNGVFRPVQPAEGRLSPVNVIRPSLSPASQKVVTEQSTGTACKTPKALFGKQVLVILASVFIILAGYSLNSVIMGAIDYVYQNRPFKALLWKILYMFCIFTLAVLFAVYVSITGLSAKFE